MVMSKFEPEEVDSIKQQVLESIATRWDAKYNGNLPDDFDIDLHKAVAKAIGGTVEYDVDGWNYIDENGRSKQGHRGHVTEDAAWFSSDEDWTNNLDEANWLFNGFYEHGIYCDSNFLDWLFDKLGLSAADRCRLFLTFKANNGHVDIRKLLLLKED